MGITQATKQKLLHEIEYLSHPSLVELQHFIRYLQFKQANTGRHADDLPMFSPEHDPILHALGIVDVAPFSETIDEIVYEAL